jgi:hypothetical protein
MIMSVIMSTDLVTNITRAVTAAANIMKKPTNVITSAENTAGASDGHHA